MVDALRELKIRAQLLQQRLAAAEPRAIQRLRALESLAGLEETELLAAVKRKHCLQVVAREWGFGDYRHARAVLEGQEDPRGYGTLLHSRACGGFLNHWFRSHPEADRQRRERGGYLLVYDRHFLVVSPGYIEALGLDPDDADWDRMGYDWAQPRDPYARRRLYAKLLGNRPRESSPAP